MARVGHARVEALELWSQTTPRIDQVWRFLNKKTLLSAPQLSQQFYGHNLQTWVIKMLLSQEVSKQRQYI
jgi:hypothetical protein